MPTFTTKTTIRHANGDKTLMAETVTETPEELPVAIAEAIPEEKAAPTEATPEEKAAPEAAPAAEAPVSAPVEPETEPEVVHAVAEEVVKVAHEGEIGKRLKKAAARVGALTVSLIWDNVDDLDLHAQTPMAQGETGHIFWNNKKGGCGGHLDVDMNASTKNMISAPIENIFCTGDHASLCPSAARLIVSVPTRATV